MRSLLSRFALPLAAVLTVPFLPSGASAAATTPQLVRYDSGRNDAAHALAVDAAGNLYLAGSVAGSGTAVTFSVVKLDRRGALVWRRAYSGARGGVGGQATAIAVDPQGNVYAAGTISDGAIFGQNIDALVVAWRSDGVERWARRYDGPAAGFDHLSEIAVDPAGDVYVGGSSQGAWFDWLTQRYTADGTLRWTRRHSGPGSADDNVTGMAVAPGGAVVVAGTSRHRGDGVTNDAEILTYDPHGNLVLARRWSDTAISHETVGDLAVDATGGVTVTGSTAQNASPEFGIPTPVTLRFDAGSTVPRVIRAGGAAAAVDGAGGVLVAGWFAGAPALSATARHDAAGNRVWSTPLAVGANETFIVTGLVADRLGAVTVAGTLSDNVTLNRDFLTIRYAADGRELWRHRLTGRDTDTLSAVVAESAGSVVVAGTTRSDADFDSDMLALRFPAAAPTVAR